MATLTITLPEGTQICNGKQITFRAPCKCTGITGLIIDGDTYDLVDTWNQAIDEARVFKEDSLVSVVLDTEQSRAYILSTPSAVADPRYLSVGDTTTPIYIEEDGTPVPCEQVIAYVSEYSLLSLGLNKTITIGNSEKSLVDPGTDIETPANVSWSLEEIGAFPTANIILSLEEPPVVNGAIWLKPIV